MNEERIRDKLLASGMTLCGAAGLVGNLQAESALIPNNLQNSHEKSLGFTDESYTAAVDSGEYQNFVRDGAGYGLAQWTYWSRKQALLNFARERGCSIGDLDMQLDFLLWELRIGYTAVWGVLLRAETVREASDAVMLQYERPADTSEAARAKRAALGQAFYERYVQKEPELQCSCGCACCGNPAAAPQRTHTVVSGDTLTGIARRYGTSVQAVLEMNRDAYPDMTADHIRVGWVLRIE